MQRTSINAPHGCCSMPIQMQGRVADGLIDTSFEVGRPVDVRRVRLEFEHGTRSDYTVLVDALCERGTAGPTTRSDTIIGFPVNAAADSRSSAATSANVNQDR